MKTPSKLLVAARQAFSLVELLVVIAVIAIIAAIAIPNILNVTQGADDAAARRNAQNAAGVYAAARAAGAEFTGENASTIIQALMEGVPGTGSFTNSIFRLDGMGIHTDEQAALVLGHLTYDSVNGLVYTPDAGNSSDVPSPPPPED